MERDAKSKRDKTSSRKVVRIRPGTKSVVLGVTGSIAAYKSAELASLLVKQGHEVFVVMTQDATEFISPLTLHTSSPNSLTVWPLIRLRRSRSPRARRFCSRPP